MKNTEYRGQKVEARLSAKLVPPDKNYPDCVCELVLAEQHLYILEDNFDGSYETHFEFVLKEIDDIFQETHQPETGKTVKIYFEEYEGSQGKKFCKMFRKARAACDRPPLL